MSDYLEKFFKQSIIEQIKKERQEEELCFKFCDSTVSFLRMYNGKVSLSLWNDDRNIYFDAIVAWKEENHRVGFKILYENHSSKEMLKIYNRK